MGLVHMGRVLAQAEGSEEEAGADAWVETDLALDLGVTVCVLLVGPQCHISQERRATTQIALSVVQRWSGSSFWIGGLLLRTNPVEEVDMYVTGFSNVDFFQKRMTWLMRFLKNLFVARKKPKPGKVAAVFDNTFEDEVLKSHLPVVVDFWASWCMPCQVMSGLLNELAKEYANRVKVLKMNVDQNRSYPGQLQIRSIPTVFFFKDGSIVDKVVGVLPKSALTQKFDRLLKLTKKR